jgi:hypothetical protein
LDFRARQPVVLSAIFRAAINGARLASRANSPCARFSSSSISCRPRRSPTCRRRHASAGEDGSISSKALATTIAAIQKELFDIVAK